jgi:phosphatidate cytidylyltransferase
MTAMHLRRVLSALLLIPAFFWLDYAGPPLLFHLVVGLVILLAAWEFGRLCPAEPGRGLPLLTAALAVAWQVAVVRGQGAAAVAIVLVGLLTTLGASGGFREGAVRAAWVLLGAGYVGGALGVSSLLWGRPGGADLLAFLMLTTWAGDTGAFYAGRTLGRHPLAPAISPKKTLEGAAGGLALAALTAIVAGSWLLPHLAHWAAGGLGILLAVAGMAGDLCESALKRGAGAKDSGALIPGHGGLLDRLDSLLFAGPVLYGLVSLGWV